MFGRRAPTPIEQRLAYRFRRRELLDLALTHRSHAHESESGEHYERLEFLGDAVLAAVTAEWLFRLFPEEPEGELSKHKSLLVSRAVLAGHARRIGLGDLLRLGVGEERSGGREKDSLLADSLEAVLGAVFLDGGFAAARGVIVPLLEAGLADRGDPLRFDAKTRLQELAQARGWSLPEYRPAGESGPDHAKTFTVECRVGEEATGTGTGPSKKIAEQEAAAAALAALEALDRRGTRSAAARLRVP